MHIHHLEESSPVGWHVHNFDRENGLIYKACGHTTHKYRSILDAEVLNNV